MAVVKFEVRTLEVQFMAKFMLKPLFLNHLISAIMAITPKLSFNTPPRNSLKSTTPPISLTLPIS